MHAASRTAASIINLLDELESSPSSECNIFAWIGKIVDVIDTHHASSLDPDTGLEGGKGREVDTTAALTCRAASRIEAFLGACDRDHPAASVLERARTLFDACSSASGGTRASCLAVTDPNPNDALTLEYETVKNTIRVDLVYSVLRWAREPILRCTHILSCPSLCLSHTDQYA